MPFEVKLKPRKSTGNAWTASLSRDKDGDVVAILDREFADVPKRIVLLNALGCLFAQMGIEDGVEAVKAALNG